MCHFGRLFGCKFIQPFGYVQHGQARIWPQYQARTAQSGNSGRSGLLCEQKLDYFFTFLQVFFIFYL